MKEEQSEEAKQLILSLNMLMAHGRKLFVGLPHWKYLPIWMCPKWFKDLDSAFETMNAISRTHIANAKENMTDLDTKPREEMSILEKLMSKNKDSAAATDDDLPSVMAEDGMMAGIDTTGNTLGFLLYHLASNPEKQARLFSEIESVTKGSGDDGYITENQINSMKYLKACVQESMRILPVVLGSTRCATNDCVIGGYAVPKGTLIIQVGQVISNEEKIFPNADKFIPERWLRTDPCSKKTHHPFASIPFSHGPRMCIGRRFATLEIYLATVKLLKKYRLEYNHEEAIGSSTMFVNRPDKPLKISFRRRNSFFHAFPYEL